MNFIGPTEDQIKMFAEALIDSRLFVTKPINPVY